MAKKKMRNSGAYEPRFPELTSRRKLRVVASDEHAFRRQLHQQQNDGSWTGVVYVPEHYPCVVTGYEIRNSTTGDLTNRIVCTADFRDGRNLPLCTVNDDPLPGHSKYKNKWLLGRMEEHIRALALARFAP